MRTIRLFVSSPGDVGPERQRVQWVADKLNGEFGQNLQFETILWENAVYSAHGGGFQDQIDRQARPADCDIVISIFWGRLGTELADTFPERMPDGKPYPSGTAYEVLSALERAQGESASPQRLRLSQGCAPDRARQRRGRAGQGAPPVGAPAGFLRQLLRAAGQTHPPGRGKIPRDRRAREEGGAGTARLDQDQRRPGDDLADRDEGLAVPRPGTIRRQARQRLLRARSQGPARDGRTVQRRPAGQAVPAHPRRQWVRQVVAHAPAWRRGSCTPGRSTAWTCGGRP